MSYLLDKKIKRRKLFNIFLFVIFLLFIIYFRSPIFNKLSAISHFVFRPIFLLGNSVGLRLSELGAYFSFKSSLSEDKQNLLNILEEKNSRYSNYASLLDENIKLKEILRRKNTQVDMILASILSKPNRSLYDSLIVDAGISDGIVLGAWVFAYGNVPIGYVAEAYENSSKIILFSNSGEKTEVIISGLPDCKVSKDVFVQIIGRGGGNFEMASMKDLVLEKGT